MNPIRVALYARLSADAELGNLATGVHHRTAPQRAQAPYVIFQKQAGTPSYTFDGRLENDLWLVKGVSRGGDAGEAEAIAERAREVLDDAPLEVEGRTHLYARRESDVDYGEADKGETIHHVGSVFRIVTEPG